MATILPFRGIRYDVQKAGELRELLAPPYDVVSPSQRDELLAKSRYNIFALELPKALDAPEPYVHVRQLLESWLKEGVLVKDHRPAIYPYDITFRVNGSEYCRKGFIALVHLEEWDARVVRPHEQTFDQVTEDRLKLLTATHAQFSQVFMLYKGGSEAREVLGNAPKAELYSVTDPAGNRHQLFQITDQDSLKALYEALRQTTLYIADGHHRYTTALNFRRQMVELHGDDPSKGYNYLMTYLVDVEDPGLVVLPTHRVVQLPAQKDLVQLEKAARDFFDIETLHQPTGGKAEVDAAELAERLRKALDSTPERQGIGVVCDRTREAQIWWAKEGGASQVQKVLGKLPKVIAQLDVVLLRRVVINGLLELDPDNPEQGKTIRYEADAVKAIEDLKHGEILFYLRSTPVRQVVDVADAGLTMPHKSTFFYPKILTGLVLNSVDTPVELP